jgi:hypothetical protein
MTPASALPPLTWRYDRRELFADGVVHVLGLGLALIGAVVLLIVTAQHGDGVRTTAIAIYVAGLLAVLALSAVYNLWPVSPVKWLLRRRDLHRFRAAAARPRRGAAAHRRMARRRHRHGAQIIRPASLRARLDRALSPGRLERIVRDPRTGTGARAGDLGADRHRRARSIRSVSSSTSGSACGFTTRSGTASCSPPPAATTRRCGRRWRRAAPGT